MKKRKFKICGKEKNSGGSAIVVSYEETRSKKNEIRKRFSRKNMEDIYTYLQTAL